MFRGSLSSGARRLAWGCAALWVSTALGQVQLFDNFEGPGPSIGDAGQWDQVLVYTPNATLAATPAAARTGRFGLRFVDFDVDAGSGGTIVVVKNSPPAGTTQYVRTWFRVVDADAGAPTVVQISATNTPIGVIADITWNATTMRMHGSCFDGNGSTTVSNTVPKPLGQWILVEAEVKSLGTASGTCSVWFDGVPISSSSGIDWSTQAIRRVEVGVGYGQRAFTGTFDFDDYVAGPSRLLGQVELATSASVDVGACTPVQASLVGPTGTLVPSPDAGTLALSAGGLPIGFFGDPGCATPALQVSLPAGASTTSLYFAALDAGIAVLSASYLSFAPGTTVVTIVPSASDGGTPASDGGNPDGGLASFLVVGCDCASTGPTLMLGAGWLLAAAHRRRPRTRFSEPCRSG